MKLLKFASLLIILLSWGNIGYCQDMIEKNQAVIFELGKNGLLYNLNYDHKLKHHNFGFRGGAGSNLGAYTFALTVGGGIYTLIGKKNKFFETGIDLHYLYVNSPQDDVVGLPLFFPTENTRSWYPSMNIGYRKYKRKSIFRAGISPGYIKPFFIPGAYVGWGKIF